MIKLVEFILIIGITILMLIVSIAAFYDLKYKKIPNLLTITTIIFGIILNSIYSILIKEINPILNSILISSVVFLLSYLLWKFRIWGGGDVKLLTAISAVLPIHPALFKFTMLNLYLPKIAIYPFPFTIIMNSILISFPVLISILLLNYMKNIYKLISFNQKSQKFHLKINNFFKYILKLLVSKIKSNINHSLDDFKKEGSIYINFKKIANSLVISTILLIIILSLKNYKFISFISFINILIIGLLFSFIFSFFIKYFISNFKVFVKKSSYKEIYFDDLEEGMILDEIYVDTKKSKDILNHIQSNNSDNTNNINNYHNFDININKKDKNHSLKSKTAAGLTKKDVTILKSLAKSEIISSYLPIKLGIPFAPSIAIGLLISIFIGDLTLLFFTTFNSSLF